MVDVFITLGNLLYGSSSEIFLVYSKRYPNQNNTKHIVQFIRNLLCNFFLEH